MLCNRMLRSCVETQAGYFTAQQARECGYTYASQTYHVKTGSWLRIEHGLYRLPGYSDTLESDFLRWSLWAAGINSRRQVVVSHLSALYYYGLTQERPAQVHLTVSTPKRGVPQEHCVLYLDALPPAELYREQGFTLTTPERTLRDLRADLLCCSQWVATLRCAREKGLLDDAAAKSLNDSVLFPRRKEPTAVKTSRAGQRSGGSSEEAQGNGDDAGTCGASWGVGGQLPAYAATGLRREERMATARMTSGAGKEWRVPNRMFTLVEMLVVIAIMCILMALLMPGLRSALSSARQLDCANRLRQIALAGQTYQGDYNSYIAEGSDTPLITPAGTHNYNWMGKLASYCGVGKNVKPRDDPQKFYTCPETPAGNFSGNYPSWDMNTSLTLDMFGPNKRPRKIMDFKTPSAKFYLADSQGKGCFFSWYFNSGSATNNNLKLAHQERANLSFLDGHVKSYGSPPLPILEDNPVANLWMSPDYPASPDL